VHFLQSLVGDLPFCHCIETIVELEQQLCGTKANTFTVAENKTNKQTMVGSAAGVDGVRSNGDCVARDSQLDCRRQACLHLPRASVALRLTSMVVNSNSRHDLIYGILSLSNNISAIDNRRGLQTQPILPALACQLLRLPERPHTHHKPDAVQQSNAIQATQHSSNEAQWSAYRQYNTLVRPLIVR
jgi:hypothetical protein